MARFRYSGTGWKVSAPVMTLGQQVEAHYPAPHPTDGTLASSSHTKWPASDHGKDPDGIVRAIDVGINPGTQDFAEELRLTRDPRLRYVIYNRRMFSSYPKGSIRPFQWRTYSGSNQHLTHTHVSMLTGSQFDTDASLFDLGWSEGEDDVAVMDREDWRKVQERLAEVGFDPGDIDGLPGANTEVALKAFEVSIGLTEKGFVPSPKSFREVAVGDVAGWELASSAALVESHKGLLAHEASEIPHPTHTHKPATSSRTGPVARPPAP